MGALNRGGFETTSNLNFGSGVGHALILVSLYFRRKIREGESVPALQVAI